MKLSVVLGGAMLTALLGVSSFSAAQTRGVLGKSPVQTCCASKKARCTGSAYCSACTNCSRCAWCGSGGTCGVCAGTSSGRASFSGSRGSAGSGGSSYSGSRPRTPSTLRPKPTPTPEPRLPQEFTARVVGITDGDTLTVLTGSKRQIRIRLYGVDAPEKAQPFGTASRTCLGNLAYGCAVWVNVRDTDRYGRTVADVRLGPSPDSRHLNAEQVKRGMAWWYRKYAPKDTTLQRLEQEARTARRGLWADAKPTPPWEWRGK